MSSTNPHTQTHTGSTTAESVDTNADGDVTVTVPNLREIESAADATAQATGGYVASVESVSGNEVTVRVFQEADGGGTLGAVADTQDVTDVRVRAEGY